MKKISKIFLLIFALIFTITGCTGVDAPGETGQEIITAKEALNTVSQEEVVLVDARNSGDYKKEHVKGAVNIARNDITTFGPFPNMLASEGAIEKELSEKGISNDSTVIVYDSNNNMDSARLWWTMKVYGHENVKVVSGGFKEMVDAGAEVSTTKPNISTANYEITEKNEEMIATKEDVKSQVDNPEDDVVILDVRTLEEYNNGTIPDSIHFNYVNNNYDDGTYRPVRQIHTLYEDKGITPDKTVIMYCKSSIRAAQTYLALYNAGYRDLKLYDGAWLEWSSDSSLPVEMPDDSGMKTNFQDGS